MNKKNLIAASIFLAIFAGTFFLAGNAAVYMNIAALAIVFSGIGAALVLSYPVEHIKNSFQVVRNVYRETHATPEDIVHLLLDLSVKCRVDGILSLEKTSETTTISFLRSGLTLLVDNYKESEIREFLTTEMAFFSTRRRQNERVFHTLARLAPAFGVAGSVIGLIGLLVGLGDPGAIIKHIPIAFVSTLYGIILSNMLFAPMAESINAKTQAELLNQKLIMEGIIAIGKEQNPYKLEKKLTSFLSPSEREGKAEALRAITKKYLTMKRKDKGTVLREVPLPKAAN